MSLYSQSKKTFSQMSRSQKLFLGLAACIVAAVFVFGVLLSAPAGFPVNTVIEVKKGDSLIQISESLAGQRVVKFARMLDAAVILLGGETRVVAGDYSFERPMSVLEVARRITRGIHGIDTVTIKIQEGATLEDIATLFDQKLVNFDLEEFYTITRGLEGYLFPDTYIFFVTATTGDVVDKLVATFDAKIADLLPDIEASGKTLEDIVTMASIVQKEAYGIYSEQQTIAGILWKRIDKHMKLQVDATLKYITGKPSSKLTRSDLTMEHEYNTYTIYGLPPGQLALLA